MAAQLSAFKAIDNALAQYYQRLGYGNYRNADGNGIFLQYIFDEELIDDDLPIEAELGDTSDPNDCSYSSMNNETEFPIPHYMVIDDEQKEAFIFYILQYCYKHSQAPSDQYIQETLIPKVGGSISNRIYPPNDGQITFMHKMDTMLIHDNQQYDDGVIQDIYLFIYFVYITAYITVICLFWYHEMMLVFENMANHQNVTTELDEDLYGSNEEEDEHMVITSSLDLPSDWEEGNESSL